MANIRRLGLVHRAYYVGGWKKVRTTCDLQWTDRKQQLIGGEPHPLTCLVCIALNDRDAHVFMAGEQWT